MLCQSVRTFLRSEYRIRVPYTIRVPPTTVNSMSARHTPTRCGKGIATAPSVVWHPADLSPRPLDPQDQSQTQPPPGESPGVEKNSPAFTAEPCANTDTEYGYGIRIRNTDTEYGYGPKHEAAGTRIRNTDTDMEYGYRPSVPTDMGTLGPCDSPYPYSVSVFVFRIRVRWAGFRIP